jgi:predicted PP-loop superfamily ATPase
MTLEEVANLQIELVELEANAIRYKDLLGFGYAEINVEDRIKIELEIPILEQRIKEVREKLENATIE